jgi:phage terminase large subunit-like protein
MNKDEYVKHSYQLLENFIQDVKSGKKIVNEWIKKVVDEYERNLERDDLIYDANSFERVLKFFSFINIKDNQDNKVKQFPLLDYQVFMLSNLYGFYYKKNNERKYNRCLLFIAKKNGKSTFICSLLLYNFISDKQVNPKEFIIANTNKQAQDNLLIIKDLLNYSPVIKKEVEVLQYSIRSKNKLGFIKSIPQNKIENIDGQNISSVILDETHGYKNSNVYSWCKQSVINRKNSLIFICSTAGTIQDGFLVDLLSYSKSILNKEIEDDSIFQLIFTLDSSDPIDEPGLWLKSNPSIPQCFTLDTLINLKQSCQSQKEKSDFITKNLNLFSESITDWLDVSLVSRTFKELDINDFKNDPCYLGIDLSNTRDLSSVSIVFKKDDKFYVFNKVFKSNNEMYNEKNNRYKVDKWISEGYITLFQTRTIDYQVILDYILEISKNHKIKSLGYDTNSSQMIITQLISNRISTNPIKQSAYNFDQPLKLIEKLILDGNDEIFIDDNPCVLDQFRNVKIYQDSNNNIKIMKDSKLSSVDSVVSMAMAFYEYLRLNFSNKQANMGLWFPKKTD